jgi:hypothetical protein
MSIEYVLWGLPKGSNDALDQQILATRLPNPKAAEKIKAIAAKDGWHSFRIQKLDLSTPPDFTKVVR